MNRTNAGANRVRIIGGHLRSRVLRFPAALQLRPTPDRVRETLFNWLGQDLSGCVCLDLFAGSGALGFEAISRGASSVTMVEKDREAVAALLENQQLLDVDSAQVLRRDALEFLRHDSQLFDIIFLDPPYAFPDPEGLLQALSGHLNPGGLVYREGPQFLPELPGWLPYRSAKAGAVHYQLLKATHG